MCHITTSGSNNQVVITAHSSNNATKTAFTGSSEVSVVVEVALLRCILLLEVD